MEAEDLLARHPSVSDHTASDTTEPGTTGSHGSLPVKGQKTLTEVQESTLKTTPRSVCCMFFLVSLVRDAVRFL